MPSYTITHTATKSDFIFNLSPAIHLDPNKKYEAALLSVNLYNSIPNVTGDNNKFNYSNDSGQTWKIITFNKGSYEIQAINDEIQRQMIINGDYDIINKEFYITVSADIAELKSIINITNQSYLVDFDVENSIGSTLGFYFKNSTKQDHKTIGYGYNKSHDIVDITKTNLVLINVSFISGSYVNGYELPAIYSFDPYKVPPGYKLDDRPNPSLTYYPVNEREKLNNIRIWQTDKNSKAIDLRGERIRIKIKIRDTIDMRTEIKRASIELKAEKIL